MTDDDDKKTKYKLRNGTYTTNYMTYREDRRTAPLPGDYDPKSGAKSEGTSLKRTDVEGPVQEEKHSKAYGRYGKRISKLKKDPSSPI